MPDGKGKKAKVILIGGQSNASGCSSNEYLKQNISAEKYAEYEKGYDNVYINFFATGTNESKGFVKASVCQGEAGGYFGPELGLAEKLHQMYPNETFFIVKYAWGGSNLVDQWLSPSSDGKTGDLYHSFVKYVQTSIDYLESKNYDIEIEGMCWMQGESDAAYIAAAMSYEENLINFIYDIRSRFASHASDDGIAFIDACIAATPSIWKYYTTVNAAKKKVAESSSINVVINTIEYGLSVYEEPAGNPDIAHYDSLSQIKLGNLFAEEIAKFFD